MKLDLEYLNPKIMKLSLNNLCGFEKNFKKSYTGGLQTQIAKNNKLLFLSDNKRCQYFLLSVMSLVKFHCQKDHLETCRSP